MKPEDICWSYVNLASRPDRREHAEAEFAKHNLTVRRFEALRPEDWEGEESAVARMMARTPGAVGCWMSQTEVIRQGMREGSKLIGVFEDDVCLCKDFPERLEYICAHLPMEWQVFYLGATFHVPGEWHKHPDCSEWLLHGRDVYPTDDGRSLFGDSRILRTPGIWGTYSYIVNGYYASSVLNALETIMPKSDGIDHAFIRLGDRLNTYCFVPGCCWQYDGPSDIGDGITEFSGFKKLGPYVWTDRMDDFNPSSFEWDPK